MNWQTEADALWADEFRLFDEQEAYDYLILASNKALDNLCSKYMHPNHNRDNRGRYNELTAEQQRFLRDHVFSWSSDFSTYDDDERQEMAKILAHVKVKYGIDVTYELTREKEIKEREARRQRSSGSAWDSIGGGLRHFTTGISALDEATLRDTTIRLRDADFQMANIDYSYIDAEVSRLMGTRTGRFGSTRPEPVLRQRVTLQNGEEFPLSHISIEVTRMPSNNDILAHLHVAGRPALLTRAVIAEANFVIGLRPIAETICNALGIVSFEGCDPTDLVPADVRRGRIETATERLIRERRERNTANSAFPPDMERQYQRSRGR